MHPAFDRDADRRANLLRGGQADAMDVGERDGNPLLTRDIDASDARHLRFSSKICVLNSEPALAEAWLIGLGGGGAAACAAGGAGG
jgi:hypothetical protein